MDANEINANHKEMVEHFKPMGFEHICYRAESSQGPEFTETWSNLEGMFIQIDPVNRTFELSVIDGMIECRIKSLGFPNRNTPFFIQKLRRHLPVNGGL